MSKTMLFSWQKNVNLLFRTTMETVKIHDKEFVPYLKNEEIQVLIKNLSLIHI